MEKFLVLILYFMVIGSNFSVFGSKILWLSNIPPAERQKEISTNGMHKLSSLNIGRGKVKIVQWVTIGENVFNSTYLKNSESRDNTIYCFTPHGDAQDCFMDSSKIYQELTFSNPIEGYYNLYLVKKKIRNDTLFIRTAKAELLNHSCRNGHKDVDKKILPRIYPEVIPLEITRQRNRLENLHFFMASGDKVCYKVYKSSKPLKDASITFISNQGWKKTVKSNDKGEAVIQVIQDYFSAWQDIDNRNIYTYLLLVEYTSEEQGIYKGESYGHTHYITSLSDGYYPSKVMYSSLSWALGLFLLCSIIAGGGVVYYRKRRTRIYREIRVDNK